MKNLLNSIVENTMEGTLKHEVVEIIMDQVDGLDNNEIFSAVEEIVTYGCATGVVPALITYEDIENFFDRHVDEILDLLNEVKEYGEITFELNRNNLAWFAFEETLNRIYNNLF